MAVLRNMATSLIKHERIVTTFAKAKALRPVMDGMVTLGKIGTMRTYAKASGFVREAPMVRKLFTELAVRYKFRPGGYTRVVRSHHRRGDNALMCFVELVDRPGELRSARKVSYQWAVARGMVPPPLRAVESLKEAAELAPSTSSRYSSEMHWLKQKPESLPAGNWRRRGTAPTKPVGLDHKLLRPVTVKAAEAE